MRRKKRRRERRLKILLTVVPVVLLAAALCAVIGWKVFVVRDVTVEGNEIYSDEQIEDWILNDDSSWNALYVFFKYKFQETEDIPFVDSMEVSLTSPTSLRITVKEKGILGYLYIPSLGQNAYFDADGYVVELSTDVIEGVSKVSGLNVTDVSLYEKLNIENDGVLRTLLNVTQLVKKYQCVPQLILVNNNDILLSYGTIQVEVGSGSLNEKILRMNEILPKLAELTGTLHLETWTELNNSIYFKENELTEIPNDVQTVPTDQNQDQNTDQN